LNEVALANKNNYTRYNRNQMRILTFLCFAVLILSSYSTKAQLGHWKLDNNAIDASGNNYNGTLVGSPLFSTDRKEGSHSLSFNGSNQYVDLGTPSLFPVGNAPRTLAAWAKTTTTASGDRIIVAYGSNANSQAFYLAQNGTSLVVGGFSNNVSVTNIWSVGVWRHICMTYDGATARIYVDGSLVNTTNKAWNTVLTRAYIGRHVTNNNYWNGNVDDVRLYDRVLSGVEVQGLANAGPQLPASPTNLVATATSSSQINLSWTDNSSDETSFQIERSTSESSGYSVVGTTSANASTYSSTGLQPGTRYYFRVSAVNGNGTSAFVQANATTPDTTPAAPTSLTATAVSSSSISLSWVDNASNESGFRIERATSLNGTYNEIATVGANVTTFSNTGLAVGTMYHYQVRAYNATGNSAYSNKANTSTLTQGSGPIAWWKLDNNALDGSGNGIHGTLIGSPAFALDSKEGSHSLTLNGSSQYVDLGTPSLFPVGNAPRTLAAWAKTTTTASGDRIIVAYGSNANSQAFYLAQNGTSLVVGGFSNNVTVTNIWSVGVWRHISMTYDGVTARIYVDGTLVTTTNKAWNTVLTRAYIGRHVTNNNYWNGNVDDVRLYDRVLSGLEVQALASAGPQLPAAPSNLTATATSSSQINLTWMDNSSNEMEFQIERSTDGGNSFTLIHTASSNSVNYTNTGLTTGSTYHYRLRAVNSGGNSDYSNSASASLTVPSAPSGLSATAANSSQINLTWTDNSNNEIGFRIERSLTLGSGYNEVHVTGANESTWSNTGLSAGTTYHYRIRATNHVGNSNYSTTSTAITTAPVPVAPSGLAAVAASSTSVTLNWVDDSTNETGFEIERSSNGGSTYVWIHTTASNAVSYTNTGLTAGSTYYYRIRATNAGGASAYSNVATVGLVVPVVPSGISATTASASQINLTWIDASSNETGFRIERSLNSGSGYSEVHVTGANVTSWSNTSLQAETRYYYRIRATNAVGNSGYTPSTDASTNVAAPLAPSHFDVAAASATSVILIWLDNSENESNFKIERASFLAGPYTQIGLLPANSSWLRDEGLTPETTYYYRVGAVNSAGTSYAETKEVTTLTELPAPGCFSLRANGANIIELSWSDNSSDETRFEIERSTSAGGSYTTIHTTAPNEQFYRNEGLSASTTYYYRIRAIRNLDVSDYTPELSVGTSSQVEAIMGDLAFQYQYDGRRRMIAKKVPGADWVYMVYDNRDRIVLTQDGNQRNKKDSNCAAQAEWTFTKYDALNRPVMTGVWKDSRDRDALQTDVNNFYTSANPAHWYEVLGGSLHGYTNNSFPKDNVTENDYLTVTYYDNPEYSSYLPNANSYNYFSYPTSDFINEGSDKQYCHNNTANASFPRLMGLVTATKVRVLGEGTALWTVNHYDDKYRVVQAVADNGAGGRDRMTNVYDFGGKLMRTKTVHFEGDGKQKIIDHSFDYDHAGRLMKTWHRVDAQEAVLLTSNEYNELGQLIIKKLHNTDPPSTNDAQRVFHQNVDYRYNIRGWLASINDLSAMEQNDLFGMNMHYNNPTVNGGTPQYNGNISEIQWKSADMRVNSYGYYYDPMNRLKEARFFSTGQNGRYDERIIGPGNSSGYDLNGNILFLQRKGRTGTDALGMTTYGDMDNLTYKYRPTSNQLLSVSDGWSKGEGFVDGANTVDDYSYDVNGNMVMDKNKGIAWENTANGNSSISYNYLNLPELVVKKTGEYIKYTYDATGRKLRQEVLAANGEVTKRSEYVGKFFYEDNVLKFVHHEEGRVVVNGGMTEYQYHLRDHLGNVRVTFTSQPQSTSATASMETDKQMQETAEFLYYDEAIRVHSSLFDHTRKTEEWSGDPSTLPGNPPTPGGPPGDPTEDEPDDIGTGISTRLSGIITEQYGLAKSLSVMPGDIVRIEVFVKYIDPEPDNWLPSLVEIVSAMASPSSGVVVDGGAPGSIGTETFPSGMVLSKSGGGSTPKAFLNYISFDSDNIPILSDPTQTNYVPITTQALENGSNGPHERLFAEIHVKNAGLMYIYLSNDNVALGGQPVDVFFDDFAVEHVHSPVVQSDDYYPFGLTFNSYSRENSVPNMYQYNGKEKQDELDLGWLDYGARMYQPEIGRWGVVDPKSDKIPESSTYTYVLNNPILLIDPDGKYPITIHVRSFAPFSYFGAWLWAGDSRGFSTNTSYTSRLRQETMYETTTQKFSTKAFGSESKSRYGVTAFSEATCDCPDGQGYIFRTHLSGNDDAVFPGLDGTSFENLQSPNIDLHSEFQIFTSEGSDGDQILTITGRMSGDGFPAAEAFVDIGGIKVFIGAAPAKFGPNIGPFAALFGDSNDRMANLFGQFHVDKEGKLLGVIDYDGSMISVEDWNKRFEEKSAK
jgi:RHS repeat-associated protein